MFHGGFKNLSTPSLPCFTSGTSCFMNMIDYYLLKGQSEFLHVKQKQLPCFVKVIRVLFGS